MTVEADGYVKITWDDDVEDADFVSYRVYRRLTGIGDPWTKLVEVTADADTYEFHDWLFGSQYSYDYAVVQVANRFGSLVESEYVPQTVTPTSSEYWLIDPYDESNNVRLHHVTADSYSDEFEKETMNLVGRGRHTDVGEHWGIVGSLTAQIRQHAGIGAREQILKLRAMEELRKDMFLRTPFGDLWRVMPGDINFDRMPGVGLQEYGNLTLAYTEQSLV